MSAARVEAVAGELPVVAIVGRPNVGKSALFNRLVRARRAIVDDVSGVTRDRVTARAEHRGRQFLCVDTGGFDVEPGDAGALAAQVRAQALRAVAEADCVVCVFDGEAGLAPADRDTVRLLERAGKPVLFAVNKIDTPGREGLLYDFYAAGVDRLLAVSAAHNRGIGALLDAIVAALPPSPEASGGAATGPRLAILGRPNVGKSSLLNRLLGEERAIVAPEAGTTRDAIDTPVRIDGRPYVLIDTAGIRRRGRVQNPLERHGAVRALGTLARSDIALIVLDATEGLTDQDARIVGRAWEAGRGAILLANKWDRVPRRARDPEAFRSRIAALRPAFAGLPLRCVSARTGEGLNELFPVIAAVARAYDAALPTPALNRALREALEATPPPSPGGQALRFLYAAQSGRRPPQVVVFASAPARVPPAYTRYLSGRLAAAFGLAGVPLRLTFRSRREDAANAPRRRDSAGRARGSPRPSGRGARPRRR